MAPDDQTFKPGAMSGRIARRTHCRSAEVPTGEAPRGEPVRFGGGSSSAAADSASEAVGRRSHVMADRVLGSQCRRVCGGKSFERTEQKSEHTLSAGGGVPSRDLSNPVERRRYPGILGDDVAVVVPPTQIVGPVAQLADP